MPEAVKDPYQVLNLKPGSSDEEIRQQYRRLAKIYHPDRNPGDAAWCEEQLTELNIAFDVLSNPARKAALDARARAASEAEFRQQAKQSTSRNAAGSAGPPPVPDAAPRQAEAYERPQWTEGVQTQDTPPDRPVRRKRKAGGAWIIFAVIAGIAGVIGWNKYAPVPPIPLKIIAPGTYEAAGSARSGTAGSKHSASVTTLHESVKPQRISKPRHTVRQASPPHHTATVRVPKHFRSLSSSQKSSVALRLAEAAEARGRASMARQLRRRGIDAQGLNYSQMRKLGSQ